MKPRLPIELISRAARRAALASLMVVIGGSVGGVAVSHATTLEQAVKMSLSNPEVREAEANRRAINQDLREARGLYFPTIDLRGDTGPDHVDSPVTRSSGTNNDWLWTRSGSLIITQKIFDGGKTSSQVARQHARVSAAAARVVERSEFVGLDAVQAYLNVLREVEEARLADENLTATVAKLKEVRSRVRAGRSSIADERQAENRVANSQNELVKAQHRLDDARAQYIRAVGIEPTALSRPTLPSGMLPVTLSNALNMARWNNPANTVALRDIRTAQEEVNVNDSDWYPDINLVLTGTTASDVGGLRGRDNEYSALLVAKWNLYSGGSDTARRAGSYERVLEAQDHLQKVNRKSAEETRRTWSAFVRQRQLVGILKNRVKASEGTLKAYNQQFQVGQRALLDVLDQQNDVFAARTELNTAEYSELFAGFRLFAVTGQLMHALKLAYPTGAKGGTPTKSEKEAIFEKPKASGGVKKAAAKAAAKSSNKSPNMSCWQGGEPCK